MAVDVITVATATSGRVAATWVARHGLDASVGILRLKTEMLLELSGGHIREGVVRVGGGVTHARSSRSRVQLGDLVIIVVVDLGAHVQLHGGGVVLVLLAHELEELRVVEHLVEWLRVRAGSGDACKCSESEVRFHCILWLNRRDFELIIIF